MKQSPFREIACKQNYDVNQESSLKTQRNWTQSSGINPTYQAGRFMHKPLSKGVISTCFGNQQIYGSKISSSVPAQDTDITTIPQEFNLELRGKRLIEAGVIIGLESSIQAGPSVELSTQQYRVLSRDNPPSCKLLLKLRGEHSWSKLKQPSDPDILLKKPVSRGFNLQLIRLGGSSTGSVPCHPGDQLPIGQGSDSQKVAGEMGIQASTSERYQIRIPYSSLPEPPRLELDVEHSTCDAQRRCPIATRLSFSVDSVTKYQGVRNRINAAHQLTFGRGSKGYASKSFSASGSQQPDSLKHGTAIQLDDSPISDRCRTGRFGTLAFLNHRLSECQESLAKLPGGSQYTFGNISQRMQNRTNLSILYEGDRPTGEALSTPAPTTKASRVTAKTTPELKARANTDLHPSKLKASGC
jgi:hypothetical protein